MGFATGLMTRWRSYQIQKTVEKFPLKTIKDASGNLTVLEKLPFDIKRVYYLHGIDAGAMRGGHAQRKTDRILVAMHGSFKVAFCAPRGTRWGSAMLWEPSEGMRVLPGEWIELSGFSSDAVCLVLASTEHDPDDSIRDFKEFMHAEAT